MLPCIIIPVHNRRDTTLECLRVLKAQGVLEWAKVVIVDDGSTDGTAAAVRDRYPQAQLLTGSGDLWWGGGINMGMRWAYEQGAAQVLWVNDDTHPRPGALQRLCEISRERNAIVTAQCHLRETGELHYGGLRKTASGLSFAPCPAAEVQPCDTICGNCVCIPRQAIDLIGLVDVAHFPHFAGDADFGLRARKAGVPVLVAGDALCDCSYGRAKNRQSWLLGEQSLRDLWGNCFHSHNGILSRCGRTFRLRHWGARGALWLAASFAKLAAVSLVRLTVPRALLLRCAGRSNTAHNRSEAVRQWETARNSSSPQ
jgi:GT2 family glycosyltransferase